MKNKIYYALALLILLFTCAFITGCKKSDNKTKEYTLKFVCDETVVSEKKVKKGYTIGEGDFPEPTKKENYDFSGWFIDQLRISAGYVINENTTILAKYTEKTIEIIQDGTKQHPYLIKTADDLINFADRINHMDEETEDPNFHKAFFKLENDIDMHGKNYTPAGKKIVLDNEEEINGFMGSFDGNNHTISNLSININMKTNRDYYGGLFGVTNHAIITNLTLDNINYTVESGSDDVNRSIAFGGVVGRAELSVFENIKVKGTITTYIFENNIATLGGIAGEWIISDGVGSYYAYTRNCYTNVTTIIGELDDEVCSLESAYNGGLFGYVYNYRSACAIYNCVTDGDIHGGKYVGGLVGALSSDNVSIIDSASYAICYATANEVSYCGGLIGLSQGDILIRDCFYNGPVVRGNKATSTTYKSYAGGIVGYAKTDDYDLYYEAGIASLNSYYNTTIRGANITSEFGISTTNEIDINFIKETLNWNPSSFTEAEGKVIPNNINIDNQTFNINIIVDGNIVNTIQKNGNSLLGEIESLENHGSTIFYNYLINENSIYRTYMPVTKDTNIYAKYYDVKDIVGIYSGTGTLYETLDAGIIVLFDDGTLQWINSSTVNGKYIYDGEHFTFEVYNNIGVVYGTLAEEHLTFKVDAGMSGEVSYEFNKIELSIFGEYFSDNGDILTFGNEGKMSFQSTNLKQGAYLDGTYTTEGNILTITSSQLSQYFSDMTITDNGDLTLTVNFVSTNNSVSSIENVVFRKILNRDYHSYPFIGQYNYVYVSNANPINQSAYTLELNEDGSGNYISAYSTTACQYYVFNNGKTIKLILEGYVSEFTYDEEGNFLYGLLNRGVYNSDRGIVLIPASEGYIYGLSINGYRDVVFATETRSFLFINGKYQFDAEISINSLEDGARITVNQEDYIIAYKTSEYTTYIGYQLEKVGEEEGTYSYNGKTLIIDGIGNVKGDITGFYQTYEDGLLVVVTDDDEFIGFNYQNAKANSGVVTIIEPNEHQGIWYGDKISSSETVKKYYKLLIDGYGHTAFMYLKYNSITDDYQYAHNWNEQGWVAITENATGLECDYNQYQHCEMIFYYNKNLMYSPHFGYMGEYAMYKDGYDGSLVPPTLPANTPGRYVGENNGISVVLNIRADLNGTYAGNPYTAIYDGIDTIIFKIGSITYHFNIETLNLSYQDVSFTMTKDGNIQEIIPEAICGVWGGTFEGYGADEKTTITIEKDGTVKYLEQGFSDVSFDYETMTITATGLNGSNEEITMIIVYNEESKTINAVYSFIYDGETYTIKGNNLTKQ